MHDLQRRFRYYEYYSTRSPSRDLILVRTVFICLSTKLLAIMRIAPPHSYAMPSHRVDDDTSCALIVIEGRGLEGVVRSRNVPKVVNLLATFVRKNTPPSLRPSACGRQTNAYSICLYSYTLDSYCTRTSSSPCAYSYIAWLRAHECVRVYVRRASTRDNR